MRRNCQTVMLMLVVVQAVATLLCNSPSVFAQENGSKTAAGLPTELHGLEFRDACTLTSPRSVQGGNTAPTTVVGMFRLPSGTVNSLRNLKISGYVTFDKK